MLSERTLLWNMIHEIVTTDSAHLWCLPSDPCLMNLLKQNATFRHKSSRPKKANHHKLASLKVHSVLFNSTRVICLQKKRRGAGGRWLKTLRVVQVYQSPLTQNGILLLSKNLLLYWKVRWDIIKILSLCLRK